MEVKLPDLLGKYDRQTDRPTDERKKSVIGKFHFQYIFELYMVFLKYCVTSPITFPPWAVNSRLLLLATGWGRGCLF